MNNISYIITKFVEIIKNFKNIKFENFNLVYLSILLIIFLIFLLRKKYINEKNFLVKKKGINFTIFLFRSLFLILLIFALSSPYIEKTETNETITKIKILIDNSESMKMYDLNEINQTIMKLNNSINLDVRYLNMKKSSIGNEILNNINPNENILLITDGQNNFGISLNDVALFSNNINTKIFGLKLKPKFNDYNVIIEGPDKVVSNVKNTYKIKINQIEKTNELTSNKPLLKLYLDNELIFQDKTDYYELKKSFSNGEHILKAEIIVNENEINKNNQQELDIEKIKNKKDIFKENNIYYKIIQVYEKPKILMISENSKFEDLFKEIYNIEIKSKLPESYNELDKYYAIILNNINAEKLSNKDIDNLEEFVMNGNGLFVIGGKNSYDWGNYNTSLITQLLPVSIGKANKKKDINNIVILFDSGVSATEEISPGITQFDVQKAMTADLIKSISNTNKVAIIEANYYLNTISGLSELGPKKSELINEITLLKPKGISELRYGYEKAYELLKLSKGSKNIVIITDGLFRDEKFIQENKYALDQEVTLRLTEKAAQDNIKTFVIGVGEKADEKYLIALKNLGNGEYFKITENTKIKLYFGDPNENTEELKIFVYDSNHFITKEITELGKIYGYNSVYPKENSRLLLTTSKGNPILTIWNYGLGRVASLTTQDDWAPDLFKKENSKVLIKTINWLIEDPERKNSISIDIPNLRKDEDTEILIKLNDNTKLKDRITQDKIKQEKEKIIEKKIKENNIEILDNNENIYSKLKIYEIKKGIYKSIVYINETGIYNILNKKIAVNYEKEYLNLGFNNELENILKITGGKLIDLDLIDLENNNNDANNNANYNINDNNINKIINVIKSEGIIETTKKDKIYYFFVVLAIITYLIEIFIRRLFEIKYSKINN